MYRLRKVGTQTKIPYFREPDLVSFHEIYLFIIIKSANTKPQRMSSESPELQQAADRDIEIGNLVQYSASTAVGVDGAGVTVAAASDAISSHSGGACQGRHVGKLRRLFKLTATHPLSHSVCGRGGIADHINKHRAYYRATGRVDMTSICFVHAQTDGQTDDMQSQYRALH